MVLGLHLWVVVPAEQIIVARDKYYGSLPLTFRDSLLHSRQCVHVKERGGRYCSGHGSVYSPVLGSTVERVIVDRYSVIPARV